MPNIVEWSIYILLSLIGFTLVWFFPKVLGVKKEDENYFQYGFLIKVFGGALFTITYFYYFQVGDTFLYHQGANYLSTLFWENPNLYFELLFSSPSQAQEMIPGLLYEVPYSKETSFEEWFLVRILSVFSVLSFQSYLIMTFFVSAISFWGSWYFYKFFTRVFENVSIIAFISSFLMPSILFWSAGILKDTFVFSFLGIFIYYFSKLLDGNKITLVQNILFSILFGYLVFKLKSYVIILLLPCIIYFLASRFRKKIDNVIIRRLMTPILIGVSIIAAITMAQFISNTTDKYQTENLMKRAEGFHTTHSVSGSYYSLGEMEYTTTGVLRSLPAAINVSLFRPYPWEFSSIIVLISSIESVFFIWLFITILIVYRSRLNYWIKKNSYFVLFISFFILFGAVVGYTSFNFGVLMRYKIPMIPFYAFTLLYYYQKRKELT
jgi:hypothetical protein